ncbi:hypothetical protein [Deinococcus pimensis]|uniref:hypothetical protein n=1 Tax=Deinococcus pimensis TaxID=309888 RepID=UPI00048491E7|nr:hypothetical protein [Deinococcus pimensis]
MDCQATLLLRLEGPVQHWTYGLPEGMNSDLLPELHALPSKRFVLSLVCQVMGLGRRDPRQVPLLDLRLGVRVDRPGHAEMEAAGRRVTVRDASFLVGLEHHDRKVLFDLQEALRTPRRLPGLARRVPPSVPLYVAGGLHGTHLTESLQRHPADLPEGRPLTFVVEDGAYVPLQHRPVGGVVLDQPRWCVRTGPVVARYVLMWRQTLEPRDAVRERPVVLPTQSSGADPWDTWEEARPRRP